MSSTRLERIGQAVRREIEGGQIPGAVVAVARKGKIVFYEPFGFADKAAGIKMDKDAIFDIASMTKPLVSAGALLLYENGQILLNDPVGKYVPELDKMAVAVFDADGRTMKGATPAQRKPTLQDLMRHTAGLTSGDGRTNDLHKAYASLRLRDTSGEAFLKQLGQLPLHYQPGAAWGYGLGFDVLGLLMESVTKKTLGGFLNERIFQPLGMKDTGFVVPREDARRIAKALPVDPITGQPPSLPDRTKPYKSECGGGCAVSTASDYLRFAQMLLNGGVLGSTRILGRKTVEFMTADQLGPEVDTQRLRRYPNLNGYGFGLGVAVRRGSGVAGVMGSPGDFNWGGGYGTYFWVDPKEQLAVVFMAAAPGEMRVHNRQLITTLVLQAIVD